jgi:glycosyltransferase involved in cell wall biosynthesis
LINNCIIFEDSSKSNFGGGQKVTSEIISILKKNNIDINLIDFTQESDFYIDVQLFISRSLVLNNFNNSRNTSINSFTFSKRELFYNLFIFPYNFLKIFKFLKNITNNTETVIICTTKKTMVYGFFIKLFFKRHKLIFHIHNYLNQITFWSSFFKYLVKFSNENWYVSESVKNSFGRNSYGKILYNPVDLNFSQTSNNHNNHFNIGVVSNLLGYKGIDFFIKSYFLLNDSYKNVTKFHIYGDGPERQNLTNIANSNKNIIFHGFVSKKDFYSNLDILVCPSIDEEAFSLVIFEAIKNSIPVIATNLKVHKEFFSDKSILFINPKSDFEISEAIIKLITSSTFRNSLVTNAQIEIKTKFRINFETNFITYLHQIS